MHRIVTFFGWLQILAAVAIAVIGARSFIEAPLAGIYVIAVAFGLLVSGALFWCFGTIVDHLRAIRASLAQRP